MIEAPRIRVAIVDDHEMILQSVTRLLAVDSRISVVGTAGNGAEAVEIVKKEQPDVVVLDYHLSDMDFPEAIKTLVGIHPGVKIVTFSGSERPGAMYASLRAGSSAWVRKTKAVQELRQAILSVADGAPYVNEEMRAQPTLDQLVVHYQPIVALADGHIIGFEALVRWSNPDGELLYPGAFLPYAEDTGFVEEIDRWVRGQSIGQLAKWQKKFPSYSRLWMGINLSTCDVSNPELFESISDVLATSGVKSDDVVVEVTESCLVGDSDGVSSFLDGLKSLGVGLALDNFGTAFPSISLLHRFPFDRLKFDMSYTSEIANAKHSILLIEEILHLADSLEMKSIAKGIEHQAQHTALSEVGWECGQGYMFSRPLSAADCEALLAEPSFLPLKESGVMI